MSSPAPPPSLLTVPPRQKHQKSAPIGITAGAEDAKYHTKYKELKRKVKDIEADNEKLHFKVLQAKLSIRRTKMERAVLYERLSVVPPSPNLQDRLVLPQPNQNNTAHPPSSRGRPPSPVDLDHTYPGSLHQGRGPLAAIPIVDSNSVGPLSSPRRISASAQHHNPYPQHMPPMGQVHHHHSYEGSRGHPSHPSPPVHHASTSHHHTHTRSHSSSRSRSQHHQAPPQPYPQQHHYPESLPSVQQPLHSPPLSERERPRRADQQHYPHDYLGGSSHADPHHLAHPTAGAAPYDYDLRHNNHPGSSTAHHLHYDPPRANSRIHAPHQRLGSGVYINSRDASASRGHHEGGRDLTGREREQHDVLIERERERDLERDIDREYRERDRDRRLNRGGLHTSSAAQHSPPHSHPHSHSHHHLSSHPHRYADRSGAQIEYAHEYAHSGSAPPLLMSSSSSSRSRGGGGDRDEPPYRDYHDTAPTHAQHASYPPPPARLSRSGTPGSGSAPASAASGSGGGGAPPAEGPSRPNSRSQYYSDSREREYPSSANRASYNTSRQVRSGARGGEGDADFEPDGHAEEGRSSRGDHPGSGAAGGSAGAVTGPPTPGGGGGGSTNNNAHPASATGQNFPVPKSRKRSRNDMEVDDDNNDVVVGDGQPSGPDTPTAYSNRQLQDDSRSSKRYHREHRRSVDNISTTHEDGRMGPL